MVNWLHTITVHLFLTARKVPHFWRLIISDLRLVIEVRRTAQEIGFWYYICQFARMPQTLPLKMSLVILKIDGIKHRLPLNLIYFRDYIYRITSFIFNWTIIVIIISTLLKCYLVSFNFLVLLITFKAFLELSSFLTNLSFFTFMLKFFVFCF